MPDQMLIQNCAPTLAGLKTGSLFACSYESEEELRGALRRLNRCLGGKGLRVLPLRRRHGRALIYVYRPALLKRDLAGAEAGRMLAERGYRCDSEGLCLRRLMERLSAEGDFPHEIGLFLGYPPEDVEGFICDRRGCKCIGCWKVYGDEQAARATFERYRKCTDAYCARFARGASLEALAVSV